MKNTSFFRVMLLSSFLMFCSQAFAISHSANYKQQQTQITGTITVDGMPMSGVTVGILGKQVAAVSTENGQYTIAADPTDTLLFSYIGYVTVSEPIDGRSVININLKEDATTLQEVTVNAGYYSVKEKERTGSIAKIKAADIEKQPVANVLATMQGRVAGVDITQDNGMPGGGFQIRIRGINSLRAEGNEPLYIIDGVPFSSESIGSPETSGVFITQTNPLNSINPSAIESIEILKDADATAIYGSRGANGVVLITTKKGKSGKVRVSVEASSGFAKVERFAKLLNTKEFIEMREQGFQNDGQTEPPFGAYDINGTWDRSRYTDWQEELIGGTAEIRNLQASISGGNANTTYFLSGNYRTETTVMPGDFRYDRGSVHFSANHTSDDNRFRMAFSTGYVVQKNTQPGTDLASVALTLAPNAPALYDQEDSLNWENGTWQNPLAQLMAGFLSRTNNLTANTVLSYEIFPSLIMKSSFGYNELVNDERLTLPHTMFNPAFGLTSNFSGLNTSRTGLRSWIIEPQLNYTASVGKSKIEALVGSTLQDQRTTRLYASGFGFPGGTQITDLASANNVFISRSDETDYKYQAIFARINYDYASKYIVNFTGRRDGSSRFGPGNQFANFGAIGAAWIFSKEVFLNSNSILSFGKLRGSYGITGNDQIGDYQFLDTYQSSGNPYQGLNGLQPTRLFNPVFGWESNRKFEVALETGWLNDRIFLTSAFYLNRSSSQLIGIPLPATTGFTSVTANLNATVENRGIEFTLNTINIKSKNFSWSSNFNISSNINKLVSFPGLEGSTYANTFVVGESVNIRRLYNYTGINQETGVYEFEDVNADGAFSAIADRNKIIDFSPRFFGGIQNQLSYKGLQLDFLFQFVNQQRFEYNAGAPGTGNNQLAGNQTGWQQAGDDNPNQILTGGFNDAAIQAYDLFSASTGAVVDASFIKLRNLSISYDLPLPNLKGLKSRIFLQGQNLLTFTNYKGTDPEFKFAGQLPPLRVITMGAQISF